MQMEVCLSAVSCHVAAYLVEKTFISYAQQSGFTQGYSVFGLGLEKERDVVALNSRELPT